MGAMVTEWNGGTGDGGAPFGEDDEPASRQACRAPESMAGERLDRVLAHCWPEFSRARLQQWIRDGRVSVDGRLLRPRDRLRGGERLELRVGSEPDDRWRPETIPLSIVHEDEALIVVDKAAGMVVHPAAGNRNGTMLNALLAHDPGLAGVPRAGIVHRLDKDTSGLLVVARTLEAQTALVRQLQARAFERVYAAVVHGVVTAGGVVDAPIGRHPRQRTRMAVVAGGREARTHYRVRRRYRAHSLLELRLETGRTHQIRVHMAHIHHPLVGDPVYGGRRRRAAGAGAALDAALDGFGRQALHAARLGLHHPVTGEAMAWESRLPSDMAGLLSALEADREAAEE